MSFILVCSIAIRVIAFGWSVLLLFRVRDWRIAFLTGMIFLMALRQTLTLVKAPQLWPLSFSANIDELPGLAVSVLAFLALLFLERMIREHSRRSAELESANKKLETEIADRKRAEEALHAVNDELVRKSKSLTDAHRLAKISNWIWTKENSRTFVDPETSANILKSEMSDLPVDYEGYEKLFEAVDPADRERLAALYERVDADGQDYEVEYGYNTRDGEYRRIHERALAEFDEAGEFIGHKGTQQDITEIWEAQKALRESEARLKLSLDSGQIGTFFWNIQDGTHFWDSRMHEIWGLEPGTYQGTMNTDFLASIHPEDVERVNETIGLTLEEDAEYNVEYRIITPNKELRYVHALATLLRDDHEQPLRLVGVCLNITERKLMSEELARSEDRLKQATQLAKLGHWIWDAVEERYIHCSEEQARIHGYSLEDFLARGSTVEGDLSFTHPEDRELYQRALGDLRKGESINFEYRVVMPGGETRYVREIARPIFDENGAVVQEFGTVQDVTETKQAERNFRLSEQRLRAILDGSPDAVSLKDTDGRYLLCNKEFERLTGFSLDRLQGKTDLEVFPLDKEIRSEVEEQERNVMGSKRIIREEREFAGADGTIRSFAITKFPVFDLNGNVTGVGTTNQDVSDLKRAEEQLRQSQKLEAVGQLTAGVAHDFNNLLAVIWGNAELLEDEIGEDNPLLAAVVRGTKRGAELTQRLLAFSRKQVLNPEIVNANNLIADITGLLRRTLEEHIDIETVTAAGLWNCEVDPAQLESALVNLAINARDAMPDGGKLTIETANTRLDDDYAAAQAEVKPGQYVMLAVTDTGSGMPPEVRDHVFEPFFTTKGVGKGTGLGLSMIYGFVKQSGGHVTVYSEQGEGTTFKLYLPRSTETAAVERKPVTDEVPVARGETVLVVEDDPDLRTLAVALLGNLGYQVMEAATGAAALEQLGSTTGVDLLLTDVVLSGGMSGPELAAEVERRTLGIKVLYMSGYTENAIVHHGRLDIDAELLQKPFRKADLARAIRKALADG